MVLDDAKAEENAALFDHLLTHRAHDPIEAVVDDRLVIQGGPLMLAEPDQHHLVQTALDLPGERRVRLDPSHDDDVVGLIGVLVEKNGHAVIGLGNLHHLHRRADGRAGVLFGDSVPLDDGALSLCGAAAVAPHGRHDEGFGPGSLELPDQRLRDQGDVGYAPAADADGDAVAFLDFAMHTDFADFGTHGAFDVVEGGRVELLPNLHHSR